MSRAAIYARYSTDRQNPDTIEVQVDTCTSYANQNNIEIVDIFADDAISGMESDRPELSRFFFCAAQKKFDTVLIYDQSRFSRDIVDWFTFRRIIHDNDVRLISVTQSIVGGDINDPAVFATEGINALMNQIHVLQTRQKVVEKMNFMARQGLHTGGKPALGFDVKDKKYVINESEAEIVRCIFDMYAQGKSYKQIILYLNEKGHRTKLGKPFGTNSISDLLRNERYIGTYVYNKIPPKKGGKRNSHASNPNAIRLEGAIPRIIDQDTWDRVQARLKDHKNNAANKAKVDYLLKGKLFCGYCGNAMIGSCSKKVYHYYICSGRQRLKSCHKTPIKLEMIEQLVIDYVKSTLKTEKQRKSIAEKLFSEQKKIRATNSPLIDSLNTRLEESIHKIRNINEAIANGIYSASTGKMLQDLEAEEANIRIQLIDAKKACKVADNTMEDIMSALQYIASVDTSDRDGKKLLLTFISHIYVYDDRLDIYTTPLEGNSKRPHKLSVTNGAPPPAPLLSVQCVEHFVLIMIKIPPP